MTKLVICGASGHAKVVYDVAVSAGFNVVAFEDPYSDQKELFGLPVVKSIEAYSPSEFQFFVAVGDNALRQKIAKKVASSKNGVCFATIIHPSAVVSRLSQIGQGTVIMAGAIVNAASKVGEHTILNTGCSIDHDNNIGDFASLAPGAVTGGNVSVGECASICIGAVVKHRVSIGSDTVVGANSYANGDIPSNVVVYGSPAKIIRERSRGTPYL